MYYNKIYCRLHAMNYINSFQIKQAKSHDILAPRSRYEMVFPVIRLRYVLTHWGRIFRYAFPSNANTSIMKFCLSALGHPMVITMGDRDFAVCPKHTAKADMHTAKALPCAAHGKAHTATRHRQSRPLPCAIYRAHDKGFAVCHSRPTAK